MSLYTRIIDLQKMNQAWDHVRKNKPAAGVDNVTCDMFEEGKREYLKQLQLDLSSHTYEPLPVRNVVIYKGEKSRTIALYAMRDKVVQQSVAREMNKIFDGRFTESTFAYRNNKSALVALDWINDAIQTGQYQAVLKVDIQHFFDSIQWNKLEQKLKKVIQEEDVLWLIRANSITRVLTDDGELVERTRGIHQGSGIAPVLSNIYLMDFDRWLKERSAFFIRYSDDILILGKTKEELMELLSEIRMQLDKEGLAINEKKTVCAELETGVEFLGHFFNSKGKSVPEKAKENLKERLEIMWLTSGMTFDEKIKKTLEIIGGWEQYFRDKREISSVFEYAALVAGSHKRSECMDSLIQMRPSIKNIYKDVAVFLADIWKQHNHPEMELYEYEDFYELEHKNMWQEPGVLVNELIAAYRLVMIQETAEHATELMQIYTDLQMFEKAAFWQEKCQEYEQRKADYERPLIQEGMSDTQNPLIMNKGTAARILKVFAGREDIYSLESLAAGGKRMAETQLLPLTEQQVTSHLEGNTTIGTFIQRPNSTVKFIVIDVDVSKRVLIQYDRSTPEFKEYLKKAGEKAKEIVKLYRNWGLEAYVEYSGCRGFHVWLLFTEWIPVRYANMFTELLERKISTDPDITIEYFPNKTRLKPGKNGQCMKLPFGRHIRTGEVSRFLDEDGNYVQDVNAFIDGLARFQLAAIKKVLAANADYKDTGNKSVELDPEVFGKVPDTIKKVLDNCNLMKYLCQKASKTGYLSQFERLSLLYVFGHMGEEGHEFIHMIMGMTLNYQYQVTQKFIHKVPDKPISCVKLRDQYKSITAEYGCSCNFKRSKNCYPSPVLHAISLSVESSNEITIPTSRTLTKENEIKVMAELNIHKKAEELAGKILDLKKQRRRLDSNIRKIENDLSKIYDAENIDCLEIEMGLLVRRKKDDGYEWVIEI